LAHPVRQKRFDNRKKIGIRQMNSIWEIKNGPQKDKGLLPGELEEGHMTYPKKEADRSVERSREGFFARGKKAGLPCANA